MIETEISKEEHLEQLLAELEQLRKKGIGDSSENEIRYKRIRALEEGIDKISPPPG